MNENSKFLMEPTAMPAITPDAMIHITPEALAKVIVEAIRLHDAENYLAAEVAKPGDMEYQAPAIPAETSVVEAPVLDVAPDAPAETVVVESHGNPEIIESSAEEPGKMYSASTNRGGRKKREKPAMWDAVYADVKAGLLTCKKAAEALGMPLSTYYGYQKAFG